MYERTIPQKRPLHMFFPMLDKVRVASRKTIRSLFVVFTYRYFIIGDEREGTDMPNTEKPTKKAEELYRRGLALFEGDGVEKDEQEGAHLIYLAAQEGHPDAKYWIEDYAFDDDAGVQGEA